MGIMGADGRRWEPCGRRGQQHCCWESLRDYSLVKLNLQPSQTELLFRSVDNSFFAMRAEGHAGDGGHAGGRERWERWEQMKSLANYLVDLGMVEELWLGHHCH